MNRKLLLVLLIFIPPRLPAAESSWVLEHSSLTYRVFHPLHKTEGVSHAARGKGVCRAGQCDFLIAVPVQSFDSGDSNRDSHMLQSSRGAQFPLASVRARLLEEALDAPLIDADLEIQFAGQTVLYKHVPLQRVSQGNQVRITGTIPVKLSDFKIDPPSLLTIPVKNDAPVTVDLTWRPE
jgi:hypothetical protein